MKLFITVQKQLALVGIHSPRSNERILFVNAHSMLILLVFIISQITNIAFILYEAQEFEEYTTVINDLMMVSIIVIDFAILIWKTKIVFTFIRRFENFIQKSEFDSIKKHKER